MSFPPSEFLRDELTARQWTPAEFARRAVISEARVAGILDGNPYTLAECERIGVALGTSAALWANLQMAWKRRTDR